MVKQFDYSKFTILFKINIVKLTNKHPKIKNSSLSFSLLKNYFKSIREICEENASKFEKVKNLCNPNLGVWENGVGNFTPNVGFPVITQKR